MKIAPSTYYYKSSVSGKKKEEERKLLEEIDLILEQLPGSGYRTVTTILRRKRKINKKKVSRIMRENGRLAAKKRSRKQKTTNSKHNKKKYPNLFPYLKKFCLDDVLVADITYFDINGKTHYLALIETLYNREIVGWAISERIDTNLAVSALKKAIETRGSLAGMIHHSKHPAGMRENDYP